MLFSKTAIVAFALGVTSAYAENTFPVYVKFARQDDGAKIDAAYDACTKVTLNKDIEAYQMVRGQDGSIPTCFAYLTEDCSGPSQAPWVDGGGILQPPQWLASLKCERS